MQKSNDYCITWTCLLRNLNTKAAVLCIMFSSQYVQCFLNNQLLLLSKSESAAIAQADNAIHNNII